MRKIIKIEKVTDLKYLNMYQITYEKDGKTYKYNVASRRELEELECNSKGKTDAVRIIPYIIQAQGYDFRQCIHLDQLQSAFRKYENRVICFTPSLKEALKFVKQALVTSLHYRLGRFFRRK